MPELFGIWRGEIVPPAEDTQGAYFRRCYDLESRVRSRHVDEQPAPDGSVAEFALFGIRLSADVEAIDLPQEYTGAKHDETLAINESKLAGFLSGSRKSPRAGQYAWAAYNALTHYATHGNSDRELEQGTCRHRRMTRSGP